MIWIWRYILGFLVVKISGENSEKFINLVAANGINIWNLYWKSGSIYGNVSINNFLKLFSIRHQAKCKISIIKRYGLTNKTKKYKKRLGLFLGAIIFVSTLYFLTNFIWVINVNGNTAITTQSIKANCSKLGIEEGVFKSKISSKYDAQRLQLTQNEVSWCSFNIEGCVLNINITESKRTDRETRKNPCNLKATIDGRITKIDVTNGEVKIKVGDVVSKGDLLVSGVTQNASSTVFVHSSGEIIAETKREFSAQGNFEQMQRLETNNEYNRKTIEFFGVKIPLYLGNIKKPSNYEFAVKNFKLFGNKIPIKIASEKYILTEEKTINYTSAELENILLKKIENQVEKFNFLTAEKVSEEVITTDKGILLKVTYNCTENIAKSEEILLSKVN